MKKLIYVLTILVLIQHSMFSQDKHKLFSDILQDNIKEGMVTYKNLVNDKHLKIYLEQLERTDPGKISDSNERLAFWINAYNAYTLKIIVDNYPVESINDLHKGGLIIGQVLGTTIWHSEFIKINRKTYSLNNIEHDIIRKEFKEPRIHFALVCGAVSCPPLRSEAYEGYKLDEQLNDQAKTFLQDTEKNLFNYEKKVVSLSKILDWYDEDFGDDDEELLKYISRFLNKENGIELYKNANKWKVKYNSYNWSINEYKK